MHDLVGRTRELTALDDAWRRARDAERTVVLITGEPGIGKSRLLDEVALRVATGGGKAVWGRTAEIGHTPAFWPWLQVLTALEVDDDRAPRIGSLEQHPDAASRLALFDTVASFLTRRAGVQPIALLFDDVHAADPSSLQLLEYVLPLLGGKRVLVVLAARDADATSDVAGVLGRVQRGARRLPLARLLRDDVAALVADRADAERVFELSEGNPLFVEELVASVEGEGVLRLPRLSSVRAVIAERVARLPEPARHALVAAALVGRTFAARVVEDMVGEPAGALQPALRLGMVAMTSPDRYRFSHALVAEAIADELDPSEAARLHLRAAQALEKHDPGDASAIAHHLLAAGNLAAEAAVAAAERAARDAITRQAFEDAAALLDRAVAALALAAPDDTRRKLELVCARAEALQHANLTAQATALLESFEPVARTLDDGELIARLALARGMTWSFGVSDPLLAAALRDALARLDGGPALLRARVLARLAAAEQPAFDPEEPAARAREAIAMVAGLPAAERLDVLYTATGALVDYMPATELEALHREVLELAHAAGARVIATHTQLRICFTTIERVDRVAFTEAVTAYRALAGALGSPRWQRHALMLDALGALLDGDLAAATRAADEAERISRELGDTHAQWLHAMRRVIVAFVTSAPTDDIVFDTAPLGMQRPVMLAWRAANEGRLAEARDHIAACAGMAIQDRNLGALLGFAVATAGDVELAARMYDRLAKWSGEIALASMIGFAVHDVLDRVLLGLAARARRWDVIDQHGECALAVADKLASPVWAARIRADWADALIARARPGDAERARELWQSALADAERLGMPLLVERARRALDPRVPQREPASPSAMAAVRIVRSGELWTVTGFGEEIHVRDSRGMQMLATLVEAAGRELHVLDLAGGGDTGDAGEVLDATARAQYRERIAELTAEREQAEAWGDAGRAERAQAELEALTAELSRAVGLGGRDRRAASGTERARSNVQRRILHAIQQIRGASQRLGEHFAATVQTGTYCSYAP